MHCYLNIAALALTGLPFFRLWAPVLMSAGEAVRGVLLLKAAREAGDVDGTSAVIDWEAAEEDKWTDRDSPHLRPAGFPSGSSANRGFIIYLSLVGAFTVLASLLNELLDAVDGWHSAAALPAILTMGTQWVVIEMAGLAEHSSVVLTISVFYFPILFAPLGVALMTKKLILKIAMAILQLLFLGVHIFMSLLLMYGIAMSG